MARMAAGSQVPWPHMTMRTSVLLAPAAFSSTRDISLLLKGASTCTTPDCALSFRSATTR
ncbi:hypothetical protein D9M68_830020 [compost metagenome]